MSSKEGSYRRFYRVRRGKVLLGLMSGLGEYFKIDPYLLRIALVAIIFLTSAGLAVPILYFVSSLFVPYKTEEEVT